ncbi:hypothetical protein F66182_9073 [Fusarium sp. NRRL 66182]|nr:hypothetical protein F66182_9073 [Fusarium sp. NRRL 66182]
MLNNFTYSLFSFAQIALGYDAAGQQKNVLVQDAATLIGRGIAALGGHDRISAIHSIAYVGDTQVPSLFSCAVFLYPDAPAMCSGRQNLTFSYDQPHVKQRIDRNAALGPVWSFARPDLQPMEYSLVVQGGDDGFAAVVEGSYSIIDPNAEPAGLLASYLISEASIAPKRLTATLAKIRTSQQITARMEESTMGVQVPAGKTDIPNAMRTEANGRAVHDESTGIVVLLDSDTYLPHIVRSYSDHPIFGPSTYDLLVYNYTEVEGVQFPQRFKSIVNNKHVTAEYVADQILINSNHAPDLFSRPGNGIVPEASVPTRHPDYSHAVIGEFSDSFVWPGAYRGTLETLDAGAVRVEEQDIPGLWVLRMIMSQAVIELEDDVVIVLDAPPHQSKLVIEWVRQRLGKEITHVWVTHHHHDHALGIGDYAKIGAKMIVPDSAAHYYSGLNSTQDQFITYSRGKSITFKDSKTQVTFIDMEATIHAHDHGYAVVTPACPTVDSPTVVFEADHAAAHLLHVMDQGLIQELLTSFKRDKVPRNAR